jgi:predicted CopG family antitoxin
MNRKTISVDGEVYERWAEHKRDDESWTDILERGADTLESKDRDVNASVNEDDPLTEDHIDDIAAEVERRVERTLETTVRGR